MIPPEPTSSDQLRPLSSSNRLELQEQDSSYTSRAVQSGEQYVDCSCCCQQEAKNVADNLRRLVPASRHRRRRPVTVSRRGTAPIPTRRHSVVQRLRILPDVEEPALPDG